MRLWLMRAGIVSVTDIVITVIVPPLALIVANSTFLETASQWAAIGQWMLFAVVTRAILTYFRLYSSLWRFASSSDFINIALATVCTSAVCIVINLGLTTAGASPALEWRYHVNFTLLLAAFVSLSRLFFRVGSDFALRRQIDKEGIRSRNATMFIGSISDASMALRHISMPESRLPRLGAIVSLSPIIQGHFLGGVPISHGIDSFNKAISAGASKDIVFTHAVIGREGFVSNGQRLDAVRIARLAGLKVKNFQGVGELDGNANEGLFSDVDIPSLLNRSQKLPPRELVSSSVRAKRVLITGGAGSIGRELAMRCLSLGAAQVTILDRSEYGVFKWLRAATVEHPGRANGEVAEIANSNVMARIFSRYRPQIVFHAAALKHVSMVEQNWPSAIMTNIVGAWTAAKMAKLYGAEQFVFISTDKAASPTTFLGWTKRFGEVACASLQVEAKDKNAGSKTSFCAVRFGNVFGSDGSVIPIFEQQIIAGGPVTVTDFNMKRYFMTPMEASDLVLAAAGTDAQEHDFEMKTFISDMGVQIPIIEIANTMIRMAGKTPGTDIMINAVGASAHEKLEEALYGEDEQPVRTSTDHISAIIVPPVPTELIDDAIAKLVEITRAGTRDDAVAVIKSVVEAKNAVSDAKVIPFKVATNPSST